ncbi:ExbD/TolR family protein [Pseudomarimonas arenosa]|uniref:Biopolymer transporter ExbD n=1 Tax=Pseudomarimonas arenosa TaxID=2774145 RepID=A0AAW3ZNY3_9GAMM|nr:biopolymer transporter ExbD [Pseudomarimonas arenosa]MBD8526349.1 biopolymer transporter ExbD [Pseudomarimonas arenosa]
MAFSSGGGSGSMADINVTPLVDVLLVLLIIFMVTAPMASYEIQIDLPQQSRNQPEQKKDPPPPVRIRIDQSGALFWDNQPMPRAAVEASMILEAQRDPQPMIELETAGEAQYEKLTDVLTMAKNSGLEKIGFVETL